MSEKNIEYLLENIGNIKAKFDSVTQKTGERFNIFEILGLSTSENRTHSAFLRALLDPNGLHGMGSKFLTLFLEVTKCENIIDIKSVKVEIEKHIKTISRDYEYGGRIDLVISDSKGNSVMIENKIYAGDQEKQLYRYYQYGKSNIGKFKLLYLTLYGENASTHSTTGINKTLVEGELGDYIAISYKVTILNWLKGCIGLVEDKPIVKEAINHYIFLIDKLTGDSKQHIMENNIKETLLCSLDNFKNAKIIAENYFRMKEDIRKLFWDTIEILLEENNTEWNTTWNEYKIQFDIEEDNDGFYFGFKVTKGNVKENDSPSVKPLIDIVNKLEPYKFNNNSNYIGWAFPFKLRKFFNLSDEEIYNLSKEDERKIFVIELIEEGNKVWISFLKELNYELNK